MALKRTGGSVRHAGLSTRIGERDIGNKNQPMRGFGRISGKPKTSGGGVTKAGISRRRLKA